jgi:hypothetical protein
MNTLLSYRFFNVSPFFISPSLYILNKDYSVYPESGIRVNLEIAV